MYSHIFEGNHLLICTNQKNDPNSEISVSDNNNSTFAALSHAWLTDNCAANEEGDEIPKIYNVKFSSLTDEKNVKTKPFFRWLPITFLFTF